MGLDLRPVRVEIGTFSNKEMSLKAAGGLQAYMPSGSAHSITIAPWMTSDTRSVEVPLCL